MNQTEPQSPNDVDAHERGNVSLKMRGAVFGVLAAPFLLLLVWGMWFRDATPPLTRAEFDSAWLRWKQFEPENYDIEIRVDGRQPATYRVEVRGGEATVAMRNGNPLKQRRTFETWSVPGMFDTMESDIVNVERYETGDRGPGAMQLTLRGVFNGEFGYPQHYRRIEWGADVDTTWEVTEFTVDPAG